MVDYVTTNNGTSAYSKFRLREFLDGFLCEVFYIDGYIHIFVFIKAKCSLFKNFFYLI